MAECVTVMSIWGDTVNLYCKTHNMWCDADPDNFGASPEHLAAIEADKGVQKLVNLIP